jgi:hypothetical protein
LQAADWLKTHINLKQSYKLSKKKISLTRTSYVSLSLNSLRIQQCPADSPQMMNENHAGLVETTIGESNDATALTLLERWKSTPIHFYQIHPLHSLGQKLMKNVLNFHPEVQHHTPGRPRGARGGARGGGGGGGPHRRHERVCPYEEEDTCMTEGMSARTRAGTWFFEDVF